MKKITLFLAIFLVLGITVKANASFHVSADWHLYKITAKSNGVDVLLKDTNYKINGKSLVPGQTTYAEVYNFAGEQTPKKNNYFIFLNFSKYQADTIIFDRHGLMKSVSSFYFFPNTLNATIRNEHNAGKLMYAIAFSFGLGKNGLTKNISLANFWMKKSASVGFRPAQKFLAKYSKKPSSNLSADRTNASNIIYRYIKANNIGFNCNYHSVNGYITQSCGSFVINGDINTNNYIISQSPFSEQLQHRLIFLLKRAGFGDDTNINLTTAFVNYVNGDITSKGKIGDGRLLTISALSDMINSGNLRSFNELVNLFVKHFEKINR